MNQCTLIGRLTKDPETRSTQAGKACTTFTLAVDRRYKDKDGNKLTDFLPIVSWGKTAEVAGKYLSKGAQCAVVGEVQVRQYQDKQGAKRFITEILMDRLELLGKPKEDRGDAYEDDVRGNPPEPQGYDDSDDGLPF